MEINGDLFKSYIECQIQNVTIRLKKYNIRVWEKLPFDKKTDAELFPLNLFHSVTELIGKQMLQLNDFFPSHFANISPFFSIKY